MDFGFGAQMYGDGVRFRLWAPGAEKVDLVVETPGRKRTLPLDGAGRGWFEVESEEAAPGTFYRYLIDGKTPVPDPASRFQPEDVHGPSMVVDPDDFRWKNDRWEMPPWHETVFYELHVGTFTVEGTYDGVRSRLNYLKELGVTAVELMPLSDFPGTRNWGYDGVLPFAPDSAYGRPWDLKRLIDEAHGLGMAVFLDVVYNHFGPDGNYLHLYAPDFFTDAHQTPWGAAIDFSVPEVRRFFVANAMYWMVEYRFDGLRLDAVHAIRDDSSPHILEELASEIRMALPEWRKVHLVLENDGNQAGLLARGSSGGSLHFDAQWNDDIHHCFHVLATGEKSGYYSDYAESPLDLLGRCLAEGFAYQGEISEHRGGVCRGENSSLLPPTAFVSFLQNHDQIGNRALGERLSLLAPEPVQEALSAVLLLSPQIPLLFMGQEWGCRQPFHFFCDFEGDLAAAVREGRRKEFSAFPQFSDPETLKSIPDPNDSETYASSVLDWAGPDRPEYAGRLDFHRRLLEIRRERIMPLIPDIAPGKAHWRVSEKNCLVVCWPLSDGRGLYMAANLADGKKRASLEYTPGDQAGGHELLYACGGAQIDGGGSAELDSWSVCFLLRW